MKHGLPFYFINRKKWKQLKSMELYFQSLIIQTIEFSWLQGGTVKNLLFHIQEAHSKQEKVHWKGAKNLQNNFYFINRKKYEKNGLISAKGNISKHDEWSRQMNNPCMIEFDRGFDWIVLIVNVVFAF